MVAAKKQASITVMRLTHIGVISAMKIGFLCSLITSLLTGIGIVVAWGLLTSHGILKSFSGVISSVATDSDSSWLHEFSLGNVLGFTALVMLLQIVVCSLLGGLFAVGYNLAAITADGWKLRFTNK